MITISPNTIINADCLSVLPGLASRSVSFILTDPPYITRYKPRDGRTVPNDDNDAWLKPAFAEMHRVLQADGFCFTFYGWPHADRFMQAFRAAGFRPVGHFSFLKRHISSIGHVRSRHETAYLLAKGNPRKPLNPIEDVIDWNHNNGNRHHPTEKPVSVLLPLIETYSQPDGLVLDPFTGSGSSLLAAKTLGRSYLGIELDRQYHAIAQRRLSEKAICEPQGGVPMSPRFIVLDGKAYVWRELVRMRREQLQVIAKARQLTLFELKEDSRPQSHRTAAGRYLEPSLFVHLENE